MFPSQRQITPADIKLGEPLAFSVYDQEGRLLLRKGIVITMQEQVDRIILRKALMGTDGPVSTERAAAPPRSTPPLRAQGEAMPVFDQIGSLILNLKHTFATAVKTPDQIDLGVRVRQLAARIQALCKADIDSSLAAPHLDHANPYLIVHQVMGAVLAEVTARRAGLEEEARLPVVCAALTRDIGLFHVQAELDQANGALSDSLKRAVSEHPMAGATLLRSAGVDDATWLDAVEQHHERLDGKGYPRKLQSEGVAPAGRILAIADTYSAMTKPRPYRAKEYSSQNALRDIYLQKDVSLDGSLIQAMIREIGIFPPGSIVKLKSGEIAVIKHCTHKPADAVVYTVYDQRGMPMLEPIRREAANPNYEIMGMVPFTECRSAAVTIKRLWMK
ncbi:HD-GYP domain-containing protein [Noviherbaspirillum sp. ST9]|uniref:HD-GYP domain-containing protein n=1 Tax=Noviherbaspirillum sp. ST9 TaxID=3401606 RepID=UPI003B588C58